MHLVLNYIRLEQSRESWHLWMLLDARLLGSWHFYRGRRGDGPSNAPYKQKSPPPLHKPLLSVKRLFQDALLSWIFVLSGLLLEVILLLFVLFISEQVLDIFL